MARAPKIPSRQSEGDVYVPRAPGEKVMDYGEEAVDTHMHGAELPGVAPPSGGQTIQQGGQNGQRGRQAAPEPAPPSGDVLPAPPPIDPDAVNALWLLQSGKFAKPFTVTLMRKTGVFVSRTAAGSKQENEYKPCQVTIHDAAEFQQVMAAVASGSYKALNANTLELQFLVYLAGEAGALTAPPQPPPQPLVPPTPPPPPPPAPPTPPGLPAGFQAPPGFAFVQTPTGIMLMPLVQPASAATPAAPTPVPTAQAAPAPLNWKPDPNWQPPK